MKKDVLIFVEDPGAATYVAPLPPAIKASGLDCSVYACGLAAAQLAGSGVPCSVVPAGVNAVELIDETSPRIILAGTAENPETTGLALISEARKRGITSIGVVDGFTNAQYRFRGLTGIPMGVAPDWIIVPDEPTRKEFLSLGCLPERVVACGHPQYDAVRCRAAELETEGLVNVRRRLFGEFPGGRKLAVFVAELSSGFDSGQYRRSADYTLTGRGVSDERTLIVAEEFLDAIAVMRGACFAVLRLHPKMKPGDLGPLEAEFDLVSSGGSAVDIVWAADLVAGMTSMLMTEAVLMNTPTLSILPRNCEKAWLPAIGMGLASCATERTELRELLGAMMKGDDAGMEVRSQVMFPSGSADRIAGLVRGLC